MRVSVDVSMYPLTSDYEGPILAFIERLKTDPALQVERGRLSTQVFGPLDAVMGALREAMREAILVNPEVVFVTKLVGLDVTEEEEPG